MNNYLKMLNQSVDKKDNLRPAGFVVVVPVGSIVDVDGEVVVP